jgi:hypothetical protein
VCVCVCVCVCVWWIFWDRVSQTLGLALNHDPPDLCLLSSQDYKHEPPAPDRKRIVLLHTCTSLHQNAECHLPPENTKQPTSFHSSHELCSNLATG